MLPFDFSQVFVITFFIGSGFIILSFFLGHMHDGEGGHGEAGHLGMHGHDGAGDAGHLDSGHAHHGHTEASGAEHSHSSQSDTHHHHNHSSHGDGEQTDLLTNVGKMAFSILSPMTMSLFLMFFGIVGYFALKIFPALGFLTLVPAFLAGFLAVKIFKRLIGLMMSKLSGSTQISQWAAVGQEAEVLSTIKNGNVGEISYIVGNKLHNGIARCSDNKVHIEKGTKVVITDLDGTTAIVEPQKDFSTS